MSKRARPLSRIDWSLLDSEPNPKRPRIDDSDNQEDGHGEHEEEEEEAEEETVHIDEMPRISQQQHGLAILESMNVDKRSIVPTSGTASGKAINATPQDEVPTVYLDEHYNAMYNSLMNNRFPPEEYVTDEEESEVEDLFASLGRSSSEDSSASSSSASNRAAKHKKPTNQRKKKRLIQRQEYDTRERGECFLCSWGNPQHDRIKAKHVNILFGIMDQYAGCHNIELALQMELYYKAKVYRPNCGMAMLTKEIALEHIEGLHSLSATLFLGESIKACKMIMFGLQNVMFNAKRKCDNTTFNQFEKIVKLTCMLYKMDPDTMLFNYGKTREDTAHMGKPFTLVPGMKQVQDKDKRAKRVEQTRHTNQVFHRGFDT
jgi:hypothetical protein